MITIYYGNHIGEPSKCVYPNEANITDDESLRQAVSHDYVCAAYRNSYRSVTNFLSSNCLAMDCDNDDTEDPDKWLTPEDIAVMCPDVEFAVHYSRNHMRQKDGKAPRPKFHILFSIAPITDAEEYHRMKADISKLFPYFDDNALDAARFFFGTPDPQVKFFAGSKTLTDYLADSISSGSEEFDLQDFGKTVIYAGSRNSTLSRQSARILKRYGDTEEAYQQYLQLADKCDPPLPQHELASIWTSSKKLFKRIAASPDYIPPEKYGLLAFSLAPSDFSDVGQATVLQEQYKDVLRYSAATDFLVYNGSYWNESPIEGQRLAQLLTARQLAEADTELERIKALMITDGSWDILQTKGAKKAVEHMMPSQLVRFHQYMAAAKYKDYAVKRRDSRAITAVLKEVRPLVAVDTKDLDADPYLLNTPSYTYDLRYGSFGDQLHQPTDYITRQTAVDPDEDNMDVWLAALDTFFCKDPELIEYVQNVVGLTAIGEVKREALFIAYGEGRNGKSTFWNTIDRVLGTYSGSISADTLTMNNHRNVKPELAEARGKRLLIAAELEEGMRLSTSVVKQLCSTDAITAEKKYQAPFRFIPSHTLVLYTNHLPKVGALDRGIWRRLVVIPFNATIEPSSDIANYAEFLFQNCGGAVLTWILDGAAKVIRNGYHIKTPKVVQDAIDKYRQDNDWFNHFIDECCEVAPEYTETSGDVYAAYRAFCMRNGEYVRSTTDFYSALEASENFSRHKTKTARLVTGLRLKNTFETEI